MSNRINDRSAARPQFNGQTTHIQGTGPSRSSILVSLITATAIGMGAAFGPIFASIAHAQMQMVDFGSSKAVSIRVTQGKSENVRTDLNFAEVLVGDPEIADVVPLTDHSLSVLGKKIGTTRVSAYAEGKRLIGVFDVEVSYDTVKLGAELAQRFPQARLKVSSVNGRIMLSGMSPDAVTVDRAVTIAKQFGTDVINTVQVNQSQQVMLEVRFVEVSRNGSRELGINWTVAANNSIQLATGTAGLLSGTAPFGTVLGHLLKGGTSADVLIRALEERDMARRLAEPNLVALSGETASFLAGGEFPFPVAAQLGEVTVSWKKFGVGLAFTPTVLSNGLINLKIEPEVSQIDPTTNIQVAGVSLPSLVVRRASTTIELRDGQSFAMAGMLQNFGTTTQQQLPWLGDVPVLGTLFRSAQYQKKETDLAIIVTPHLVRPTRPGDALRTPFDDTLPANDADLFLLGQQEVSNTKKHRVTGEEPVAAGHILDLPKEVSYVVR
ncbi:MAG TPA: type II and III secretion system protein family protein [Xanthobacteraceae bacterium]|nr:type II and III secretion system protein family protein [Xanthobacteraceae bacterium]